MQGDECADKMEDEYQRASGDWKAKRPKQVSGDRKMVLLTVLLVPLSVCCASMSCLAEVRI
jgi:hypothetical protein